MVEYQYRKHKTLSLNLVHAKKSRKQKKTELVQREKNSEFEQLDIYQNTSYSSVQSKQTLHKLTSTHPSIQSF
jgi:hypothetical protein